MDDLRKVTQALDRHEAPHLTELRRICDAIGYGRVIQLSEQWMDEKHPGWVAARRINQAEPIAEAAADAAIAYYSDWSGGAIEDAKRFFRRGLVRRIASALPTPPSGAPATEDDVPPGEPKEPSR